MLHGAHPCRPLNGKKSNCTRQELASLLVCCVAHCMQVLSWPYAPLPVIFSQVVAEHVAQQQGLHKAGSAAVGETASSSTSPVVAGEIGETAVPVALPTSGSTATCLLQSSSNGDMGPAADSADCGSPQSPNRGCGTVSNPRGHSLRGQSVARAGNSTL